MNESQAFILACSDRAATPPVLCGVEATCRLDGTLFELTLRQTYRNTGTALLEVVYTFPLLPCAVLTGFGTELNGARMDGQVMPRRQAEQTYEAALSEGDAPVMLEAHEDGLHTANIGNLKPGDELVVELRMAQLVAFEQGRLRLAIPSTIAPRYGDAARAGLQPQQVPVNSLMAEYPLALTLRLAGVLAEAAVECPTHPVVSQRTAEGLSLSLGPQARLDRDVVVIVTPAVSSEALVVQARDARATAAAPTVLLAALPVPAAPLRDRIALKLLVDCSGSMAGSSMASAQRALVGIADCLGPRDTVSLTRFGSSVSQVSPPSCCTPQVLARLRQDIAETDANLGGTEMEQALSAVFKLALPADAGLAKGESADVLLITDGEVWQVDEIIAAARRSAQRVFVIGVGDSPAEGVLRRLAEATGGACEFATPGEALEAASARMLGRIRQQAWRGLQVDWGTDDVAWQGGLPLCGFGGDTLTVFAGVREGQAAPSPVRLLAQGAGREPVTLAVAAMRTVVDDDTLPRVAAAGRLSTLADDAAMALAVDYQLMSEHTNCVLVHRRTNAERSVGDAQLHQVQGMLAAGWGGMGMVEERARGIAKPKMAMMPAAAAPMDFLPASLSAPLMRKAAFDGDLESPIVEGSSSLAGLATVIGEHLWVRSDLQALMAHCRALGLLQAVGDAIDEVVRLGVSDTHAWALLVRWLDVQSGSAVFDTAPASLQLRIQRLDEGVVAQADEVFQRRLGAL